MCGFYSKRPFFSPPKWGKKHCFWKIIVSWTLMILLLDHSTPFQYPSGWLYFHPAVLAGSSHQKPLEAEFWTMAVVFLSGRELFLDCHNWRNSSKIVKRSSANNLIDVLFLSNVIDRICQTDKSQKLFVDICWKNMFYQKKCIFVWTYFFEGVYLQMFIVEFK